MRPLSSSELLMVWERGLFQHPIQRGLSLLIASCPEMQPDELARLSIGKHDSLLLKLREQIFGPELACLATCHNCSERLELTFNVEDILAKPIEQAELLSVQGSDYGIQFRLPGILDLMAVANLTDLGKMKQILIERCLVDASYKNEKIPADLLPAEVVEAVMRRMSEVDPQADVQVALSCPACGHEWQEAFDIASFFWEEINAWGKRVLYDIHVLASAYGWSEAEILALSPYRRQAYLDLVVGR